MLVHDCRKYRQLLTVIANEKINLFEHSQRTIPLSLFRRDVNMTMIIRLANEFSAGGIFVALAI